jgi:acetyl-CoA synthetase
MTDLAGPAIPAHSDLHVVPSPAFASAARIGSHAAYTEMYRESLEQPEQFWRRETQDLVFRTPMTAYSDGEAGRTKLFVGATLNVSESCLDRHLLTSARTRAAIIWEGEPGETRTLTYFELHREVVRLTAALADLGVQAGDRVAIYMGLVPEAAIAMLACARLGATHNVVFGGFSAEALRDRINDCGAKVLLTQDGAYRRGNVVPLKALADEAAKQTPRLEKIVVYARIGEQALPLEMKSGRDVYWHDLLRRTPTPRSIERAAKPDAFDAEHPLFVLYTSGSTGKPKGLVHSSAGYLAGAYVTAKYVFDLQEGDLFWCTADVGWVTGHSYLVYGPLANGASCMMYEGAPNTPDWGRFWSIIERHGVTILYTAPTAVRAFIRAGDDFPAQYNLSSLRLLGSVGEPINPEAWTWYHRVIGGGRCPIVDTWWQTETGSIMLTTLPGASAAKPGATGLPMFGVQPLIVDEQGIETHAGVGGKLVLESPWPSMARTIYGDDARYLATYWTEHPGRYTTGDGAKRDKDGYFWVTGRIDDVLNVAGHRIGTAEIESAIVSHPSVAEAAAVGRPDDLKGQAVVAFVTLKAGLVATPDLKRELSQHVEREIGKFARPEEIRFADALPKTRSGKIMRRLLKDIAAGTVDVRGDTSTLEDLGVLAKLRSDES